MVLTVAGSMARENVAATGAAGLIPVAPFAGEVAVTVGGGGGASVVKLHVTVDGRAVPSVARAAVVIRAV